MFTKKTRVISMIATVCMVISMLACIAVPAYADEFDAIPSVSTIAETAAPDGDYKIASLDDWLYLDNGNEWLFRSANITIHLTTDIDLDQKTFNGFHNLKVKFDGHGHTVKNWYTPEGSSTNGIFDAVNNGNGMVEIKNLKVDNCNVTGVNGSAIIYGVSHANAGQAGLPTNVLIENIEVTNSSITNPSSENTAIILSRYASTGAASTVTMRNIKITGSTVNSVSNHFGLLIGKPRGGNASDPTTYNIQNVILENNKVIANGGENGNGPAMGLLFGTAENSGSTCINMTNVYANGNTLDGHLRTNVGIMGTAQTNFVVNAKGVVINNTTASVDETSSLYMVNTGNKVSFTNVYSNATVAALTSSETSVALSTSKTAADAYAFNENAGTDSILYWTIDAGELVPTTKEAAMRKVTMELTNGDPAGTFYAAAGSTVALSYEEDANATFSTANAAATISGNQLTLPTDGTDVTVVVTLGGDGELNQAKADLQEAIDYFKEERETKFFVDELIPALDAAEAALESSNIADIVAAEAALMEYADQYKNQLPNLPNVTDVALYEGAAGYMIESTDDLIWLQENESKFTKEQTVYLATDLDLTGIAFTGFDATASFRFNGLNHTIANWTYTKQPASANDLNARVGFYVGGSVTRIENVTFDNATLKGGRESAIVYASHQNDQVTTDGLTIHNVHVINSTLYALGNHNAIFMPNLQAARTGGLLIDWCTVIDTKVDCTEKYDGAGNNSSAFLGRAECGSARFTGNVQIQNCYANNFDVIKGGQWGSIFAGSTSLYNKDTEPDKYVYPGMIKYYNCAAVNCDIEGEKDVYLFCGRNGGPAVNFRDIMIYNCKAIVPEGQIGAIVRGNQDWFRHSKDYRTRLYYGNEWNQSNWFANTNAGSTNVLEETVVLPTFFDAKTELAEMVYTLNQQAAKDGYYNFWCINEDGDIAPVYANGKFYIDANGKMQVASNEAAFATDKAGALVKYTLVNANTESELVTGYANGGSVVELNVSGATAYALAEDASATASINGNQLTMPNDFSDVTVKVSLEGGAAMTAALQELVDLTEYFEEHKAEISDDLQAAIDAATEVVENSSEYELADAEALIIALEGFRSEAPYLPRVTEIATYPDENGYMLWDESDFRYVANNTASFNVAGLTLYMGADVDFAGSSFQRISDVKCDFDGMGHTITNYNPTSNAGLFVYYKGTSIKNVTFKNCTAAGGYSRAILISELQNPSDLVIENVDMENVTLKAAAGGNQMGLYISRTSAAGGKITIKNCEVNNCTITNDIEGGTANVNNSGLIIGCIKEDHEFLAENIVIKNSSSLVDTKAGGLVFGSFETSKSVTIKNVAVYGGELEVGEGVQYAGIMVGIHNRTCPPSFENCVAYGVKVADGVTATWARGFNNNTSHAGSVTTMAITAVDCAADFNGDYVAIDNGSGLVMVDLVAGKIPGVAYVDSLIEAVWEANDGEDIWTINAAADDINLGAKEGFGIPYQVTFIAGEEVVATFYTGIDGKLPAEASKIIENAVYSWPSIDMNTAFTEDTEVTASAIHSFNGEIIANNDGTHKIYCDDSCGGCDLYILGVCDHKEYVQNADNTHSSKCECGYILATDDCEIEYTFDGIDSHTGLCETCGRVTAAEKCNMGEFVILPGDEPTTTAPGEKTSSCDKCDHEEAIILNQLAAAKVIVAGGESVAVGETYSFDLKLQGNANPGVSGMVIKVEYDQTKFTLDYSALNPTSGFAGYIDDSEAGIIKIGVIADAPVCNDAVIAIFDMIATDDANLAGATDIKVSVYDVVLSATAEDDATTVALDMKAEGTSVNIVDFKLGDVNQDGNITIADAVLVLRTVAGTIDTADLDMIAADVTGEGTVDTADAVKLLQFVLGEIDSLE